MAKVDWEVVETDYRTGQYSNRELSRLHGASESYIRKKAKDGGWTKDLTAQVRTRTREKAVRKSVTDTVAKKREEAGEDTEAPLTDNEIIEAAAENGAQVIGQHKNRIGKFQGITTRFAELLETQLASGTITMMAKSGEPVEIDVPLDYVGKSLANGTMALQRLIELERQAHNLDNDPNKGSSADVKSVMDLVMGDPDGLPGA